MHILAICGSLQAKSSNRALIDAAARVLPPDVRLTVYEGLRALPMFDPDLERERTLPIVDELRRAVATADALLVACPEYGHSLPGSLKNAIDWLIGSGELEQKLVAITAAVPHPDRGRKGLAALAQTLGAVSARVAFDGPLVKGPGLEGEVAVVVRALVAAHAPASA